MSDDKIVPSWATGLVPASSQLLTEASAPAAAMIAAVAEAPAQTAPEASTATVDPVLEAVETVPVVTGVIVNVPKAFKLRVGESEINFAAGVQRMEKEHVDHWYSVVNGVVQFEG